jgi:hypothetical protein
MAGLQPPVKMWMSAGQHTQERAMNFPISAGRTDERKEQRKGFLMAVGGVALALTVAAGLGAWQTRQHHGSAGASTAVTEQHHTTAGQAGTLGGVSERIAVQAGLAAVSEAPALGGVAESIRVQEALLRQASLAAAQGDTLGGVAERTRIQGQLAMTAQADRFACGSLLQRPEC